MSPRSSGGAGRGVAGGDIVDLDRYVRGQGGGGRTPHHANLTCQRLVVDAGGAAPRATLSSATPSYPSLASVAPRDAVGRHDKRASHDSGLSDYSSTQRKKGKRRGVGLTANFDTFRVQCERALREQRVQIAHVAELCERLAERQTEQPGDRYERLGHRSRRRTAKSSTTTSDLSSFTGSSNDKRRSTNECKTYKLIMCKLDEMERALSRRRAAAAPPFGPALTPAAPPHVAETHRAVGSATVSPRVTLVDHGAGGSVRLERRGRNTQIMRCSSNFSPSSSKGCFDLDDPIKLYEQAKRLQAMPASYTRRALSVDCSPRGYQRAEHGGLSAEYRRTSGERGRTGAGEQTLCSICRGYWKSIKQCLISQMLSKVDTA